MKQSINVKQNAELEEKIREDERRKVVDKILKRIELEYDLNYGETLLNPRYFYELVEDFK